VVEGVTDGLSKSGTTRDAAQLLDQPSVHCLNQRPAEPLTSLATLVGGLTADVGLDLIQSRDPVQSFGGERRLDGDMDVVELAPRMPLACHSTRYARGTLGSLAQQNASRGLSFAVALTRRPNPV
jgi:hypothetical protein